MWPVIRLYRVTEPFFLVWFTNAYRSSLESFMRHRYIAPIILLLSGVAIYYFWMTLPSEMSPMEDRARVEGRIYGDRGIEF